jgi:hypothetical protein
MEGSGVLRGFDREEAEDITVLSEAELRERLQALTEEEKAVSYRRHILQGRMDPIRAELEVRSPGMAALTPEDLARVLLGYAPGDRE